MMRSAPERALSIGAKPIAGYGLAMLFVAMAAAVRLSLDLIMEGTVPFATFFPAILAAAFVGGLGPGIFATGLSGCISWYVWLPPDRSMAFDTAALASLCLFIVCASIVVAAAEALRIATHRRLRAEKLFRIAQDLSLDAYGLLESVRDRQGKIVDFRWIYANGAAQHILLTGTEKLVGQRLLRRLPGARDNPAVFQRYIRIVETGEGDDIEFHYQADGIDRWFRNSAIKIGDGVAVTFRDVTDRKSRETELWESKDRLAAALKAAGAGTWRWTVATGEVLWDTATHRLFGVSDQTEIHSAEQVTELIHPEDRAAVVDTISRCVRDGTDWELEYRVPLPDGGLRWLFDRGRAVRDQDGHVAYITGACVDITEKKRAEAALRDERDRARNYFEIAGVLLIVLDVDGRVKEINRHGAALLGYEPQDIVGSDWFDVFTPKRFQADFRHSFAEMMAGRDKGREVYASPILRAGGEERMISWRNSLVRDGFGRIVGTLSSGEDITDRLRVEATLRDSEARLRLALEAAELGTWHWDITKDEMVWSERSRRLFGVTMDTVLSYQAFLGAIHEEDREGIAQAVKEAIESDADYDVEMRVRQPDGGYRWVRSKGRAFRDEEGRALGMQGVGLDIEEKKQLEYALLSQNELLEARVAERTAELRKAQHELMQSQKMEAVGQLTGGIAHDFNNLLQALRGCFHLLDRRAEDPRIRLLISSGIETVQRGARLTGQLMAFARRKALRSETIDFPALLSNMAELLARSLRRDIEIDIGLQPDLWPLKADPTQLELALINLAVNARDALSGPGVLSICAENATFGSNEDAEGLQGDFVRITVADNGVGMTPEVLTHAFEPFFTTKELGKGTGLGLATVYGFARQSGGSARVESQLGAGTKVILYLPRADSMAQVENPPGGNTPVLLQGTGRVLLVEDDDAVGSATANILMDLGYTVARAANAAEALVLLESGEKIDVVFSDIMMPGSSDGLTLARDIRHRWPDLPVVLATGYSDAADSARAEGFRLLAKPYEARELLETLHEVMQEPRPS